MEGLYQYGQMYGIGAIAAIVVGILGLGLAFKLYRDISSLPAGNDRMKEIAGMIHDGAMAFLFTEYRYSYNRFKFEDIDRKFDYDRHEFLAGVGYHF